MKIIVKKKLSFLGTTYDCAIGKITQNKLKVMAKLQLDVFKNILQR